MSEKNEKKSENQEEKTAAVEESGKTAVVSDVPESDDTVEAVSEADENEELEAQLKEVLAEEDAEDVEPDLYAGEADAEPQLSVEEGENLESEEIELEEEEISDEEKAERKRKRKKVAAIVCGSFFGTLAVIYLGFAAFFIGHFYFNTEINGVPFSAKSVKDVESYMKTQVQDYELTLMESDGGREVIDGTAINLSYEESDELQSLLKNQNPLLWISALWKKPVITASVGVSYDESKLNEIVAALDCMKAENQVAPENAKPEFNGTEFVPKKEVTGSTIDTEAFPEKIREALDGFRSTLDMTEEECYVKPKYLVDSEEVIQACATMNEYLKANITYTFGSATEAVDAARISQWLVTDDNMTVTFNTDAVKQYIQELAGKYDTYRKQRTFTSGNGNQVSVEGGSYGWRIDQETELAALTASIQNGEVVTKEPAYLQTAASHDGQDWGNTYVEVDLTNQNAYLFVNGSLVVSGPCVTGKPSAGDATPQGVYSIRYCQRNATLRGPKQADGSYEWESPVSFWMPFNGGIGLHDAPWQAAFGGSRYLTHGSHGCVNLQYSVAETIFNNVSAGTPVVCHY